MSHLNDIIKGKLLVAEPSTLMDKSFNRSIILIADNNDEGTVGFIMNKPTEFIVKDLIFDFDCDFRIYKGGPVETDNLYFIHKIPSLIPDAVEISEGLYWGGNYNAIKSYIEQGLIKKDEIRFFIGYSGWGKEQLELEIEEKTWKLVVNSYPNIFDINDADEWKEKLFDMGGEYKIWANSPDDPTLN